MAVHSHTVNTADTARAVSLYLGVSSSHPAILAIASRISLSGLRIGPGADLSRDPEFHARIVAVGGRDLLEIVDHSRRAQIERDVQGAGAHAFRYASLLGGLYGLGHAWNDERGTAEGEVSSAAYDGALISDVQINDSNYHRSRYGRGGVPRDLYNELRGNFSGDQIFAAARDAEHRFDMRGNRRMIRSLALIHRDDNDAPATIRAMEEYQRRLAADREMADLTREYQAATTPEAREAILARMQARDTIIRSDSGVEGRLADPGNDKPGAREGITEGTTEMRRKYFRDRNLDIELGAGGPSTTVLPTLTSGRIGTVAPIAGVDTVDGDLTAGITPTGEPLRSTRTVVAEVPTALSPHP